MKITTPHIIANKGDFAKTVLMPGDPLRSKFIAENFLENAILVNNIRGVQGYTGFYKGKKVSVMASGMGLGSMGIYSYELFKFFGVENIIRVGSAGGLTDDLQINDVLIADNVVTDSNILEILKFKEQTVASEKLLNRAIRIGKKLNKNIKVGTVISSDVYYGCDDFLKICRERGIKAVEMETSILYANAKILGKNALSIFTILNLPFQNIETRLSEKQTAFVKMIELALEIAIND